MFAGECSAQLWGGTIELRQRTSTTNIFLRFWRLAISRYYAIPSHPIQWANIKLSLSNEKPSQSILWANIRWIATTYIRNRTLERLKSFPPSLLSLSFLSLSLSPSLLSMKIQLQHIKYNYLFIYIRYIYNIGYPISNIYFIFTCNHKYTTTHYIGIVIFIPDDAEKANSIWILRDTHIGLEKNWSVSHV